jgi:nitrite reductase/ring-hydroxylating ferredoxin subunit
VTDIPTGAWTVALALDGVEVLAGRSEFIPGADAAVAIGVVGAIGSAVTGLAQWQYTDSRSRRLGLAHALLNTGALTLYSASMVLRARGKRGAGHLTALLGYSITLASAYLGGDLAFGERVGVDHSTEQELPTEYTAVLRASELSENTLKRVEVQGVPVLLVRQGETIYALDEVCSHLGGPLAEGQLEGCSVICPWHASRFALDDGRVLAGPATFPQPHFETRVRDGQIEVRRIELSSKDGR